MTAGDPDASYATCPAIAGEPKRYAAWLRDFKRWVRQTETLTLYRSKKYRLTSEPGETEGDFRARLQIAANEKRDQAIAKIRKRYASKTTTLENQSDASSAGHRARVRPGNQEVTRYRGVVWHSNTRRSPWA